MKRTHGFIISLFTLVLFDRMGSLTSCKKTGTQKSNPCKPRYAADIKPIISSKCAIAGCHDANSTVAKFTNDSVVKDRADAGRIRSHVFELKIMPPQTKPQLSDEEKTKLKCWLDNGAELD